MQQWLVHYVQTIKKRTERMCERLNLILILPSLAPYTREPLWITCRTWLRCCIESPVSTDGLGEQWLGVKIDKKTLDSLSIISSQFRFNLDGEGGEFETIVVDAPHMKQLIEVLGHPEERESRNLGYRFSKIILNDGLNDELLHPQGLKGVVKSPPCWEYLVSLTTDCRYGAN